MNAEEVHAVADETVKAVCHHMPGVVAAAYLWPPVRPTRVRLNASWRIDGHERECLDVTVDMVRVHMHRDGIAAGVAECAAGFARMVSERIAVGRAYALADALIAKSLRTELVVEHKYDPALASELLKRSSRSMGTAFAGEVDGARWHIELK